MKKWTVLRSSELSTSRQYYYDDFQAKLKAYTGASKAKSAKQLYEA